MELGPLRLLFFAFGLLLAPVSSLTPEPTSGAPEMVSRGGTTAGSDAPGTPSAAAPSLSSPGPTAAQPSLGAESPTPSPTASTAAAAGATATSSPTATSRPTTPEMSPWAGPWPTPVTDVAKLCTCDLLVDECDINCCCDPDCTALDFSVFTKCSVAVVTGDSQLCRQQEALYSLDLAVQPPERVFELADKINPNVFCIQKANYEAALSFQAPEIPTSRNFDQLLYQFGERVSGPENDLVPATEPETNTADDADGSRGYQYRDPIQTLDGFLKLPAPLFFSQCAHNNPAGFLMDQTVKCSTLVKTDECLTIQAFSMQFYTNGSVLAVNISIGSMTVQAPDGLQTRLNSSDVLLLPTADGELCNNVVLEAGYLVTFTEAGEITKVALSLVLGTVDMRTVFVLQSFKIQFIQEGTQPVHLSGNPGYVVGLPIKAGFRTAGSGVIQNLNSDGQLTIMKSSPSQDCLSAEGMRTPVLFGYNMVSGCQLSVNKDADCTVLASRLLEVLKGQNFPDYVASFGDSLSYNGPNWVSISYNGSKPSTCEIPVSFAVELRWTKYGSLVNPQAKIVSVSVTTMTMALPQADSGNGTIQVLTSAAFVDVSAPAEPEYKARPTIEARLPFDFFFPFV